MEKKRQGENNSCESKTRIWEPTGKGNVEIDLTVARYHEWLDRILEDNANARDRQPFNIWGECQTLICQSKQLLSESMASLGRCCGSRLYIYKDQPGWCVKDRVLIEDKEELQNPDVALIFAGRDTHRRDRIYWRGHKSGILGLKPWCRLGFGVFGCGDRGLNLQGTYHQ